MGADAAPNDVRLTWLKLVSVLECRSTIRRPSHLPYAGVPLPPLDAQSRMEAVTTARKVGNELRYRLAEGALLL
jgi:hypothetical protein